MCQSSSEWRALPLSAPLMGRENPESVAETALVYVCMLVGVNVYNKPSMQLYCYIIMKFSAVIRPY